MTRANILLSSALVATAFAMGCEWTSSDGIAWDETYDNVNFSGTYPIGNIIAETEEGGDSESSGTASDTQTINGSSGQLKSSGIQKASITVYAKDGGSSSGTADAPGPFTFDNPNYSGSISEAGFVNANIDGASIKKMVVSYTYAHSVPTTSGAVTSITVHQTGQNVTMTLNDGSTFSGKISGYDASSDSITSAAQVIAKYDVSGAKGKIHGTLTSTTSSRIIDGVLTIKGSSTSFSGSTAGSGRANGSDTSAE